MILKKDNKNPFSNQTKINYFSLLSNKIKKITLKKSEQINFSKISNSKVSLMFLIKVNPNNL